MHIKRVMIMFACLVLSHARGGTLTHKELVEKFREGIQLYSEGKFDDGFGLIVGQIRVQKSPKERAADISGLREGLGDIRDFGSPSRVEVVSVVFLGESYSRVRIVDRRSNGAILFTIVGEKFDGKWYYAGMGISAHPEITSLLKEMDAADFTKEMPQTP